MKAQVHPSAIVDNGAIIGDGTRVWHFVHIMPKARIGKDCVLGQNVFVADHVRIGDRVKIQNNVSVYTGVEIEDEAFIGPSAVFTNVINPRGGVERKDEFRTTHVGKGATIGANATILCGVRLGDHAFVGAGTVVTRDVPAYALVTGNPSRQTGWMSIHGHKLAFEGGTAICPQSGWTYSLEDGRVSLKSKAL
jgi:UDP-2-acetamido-3-amino-2,3-dideoxy-glucuronate N-acetyltransferase